jgi:2-polyprenyl-3-methyl-5-hydroxy-6-metoxy-1,4-benzoquinol methylase
MLTEREKYELVWRGVEHYGKDWMNHGLAGSIKRWIRKTIPMGATVMDFGCGNATSLEWLASVGFKPAGVEIARNATNHPRVIFGDMRENLNLPVSDYGICTDFMEHIPTDDVDAVLDNIASAVRRGVLFVIARDEDKDGISIGQQLHLTRKPREWWDEVLLCHFSRIQSLLYEPAKESAYCLWAWKC